MTGLAWLTATQAIAMIARKELSPVEYLDAILSRAEAASERLNPFSHIAAERARMGAKAAEAGRGTPLGASEAAGNCLNSGKRLRNLRYPRPFRFPARVAATASNSLRCRRRLRPPSNRSMRIASRRE